MIFTEEGILPGVCSFLFVCLFVFVLFCFVVYVVIKTVATLKSGKAKGKAKV